MTLNASGPISLGGSTAGQSVNLELGQSATAAISFNDAAVRTLTGTTAGTSLSMPGGFWGKSTGPTYFISTWTGATYNKNIGYGVVADSSNNLYVAASTGSDVSRVHKYLPNGTYVSNLAWTAGAAGPKATAGAIDRTNNILYINSYSPGGTGGYTSISPTTLTVNTVKRGATTSIYRDELCVDSAGNLIVALGVSVSPKYYIIVYKYDSSGTLLWQKRLEHATLNASVDAVATDSSNNIYICGSVSPNGFLCKLDPSGNIVWSKQIAHNSALGSEMAAISITGATIYVNVYGYNGTSSEPNCGSVWGFDTSGNLLGSRGFYSTAFSSPIAELVSDSSGVYVIFSTGTGTVLQLLNTFIPNWAGKVTQTSGGYVNGNVSLYSGTLMPNGGLALAGYAYGPTSGEFTVLTACVPTDGSLRSASSIVVGPYTFTYNTQTDVTAIPVSSLYTISSLTLAVSTFSDALASQTPTTTTLAGTGNGPGLILPNLPITYLVVGGGGGGGSGNSSTTVSAGGGGAGSVITGSATLINSNLPITVTVGAGGIGASPTNAVGGSGGTTSFFGNTATGGSGGGAANGTAGAGGASGNGFSGGAGASQWAAGGGAGSTGNGVAAYYDSINPGNSKAGNGGAGSTTTIRGSSEQFAGGGGGAIQGTTTSGDGLGQYGGGKGTNVLGYPSYPDNLATSGSTWGSGGGGGGGGGSSGVAGNGASGVVVVSYQSTTPKLTGGTVTSYTSGGNTYQVHTFTSSGTLAGSVV